ncbi:hypothetical protein BJ085DRAFT_39506 [Dimargaris cristalligena]|uniref:Uncharacterized protein n=1 Tax=Dimargaris cristalligena TaxID=215637 RepID=A0A4Q0A2B4_9FUNG|nr:hypothetical protein BJ085DRAFT_39506 [Dimargaris cristalligena]|eukprot:RKP40245.1 hypothetical protein BJ085DRAFT_39506 [Dimargaris cristalligena]
MDSNAPRQLAEYTMPEFQPSELRRTFVARLNQYAPNKVILSYASVRRTQALDLRPLCFQHTWGASSSPDAHEIYCVLIKYRNNIQQITLILDSEATADPQFSSLFGIAIDALLLLKSLVIEVYHPALLNKLPKSKATVVCGDSSSRTQWLGV